VVTEGAADFVLRGAGLGTNWQGYYNTGLAEALARGMKARPNDLPAPAKLVLLTGKYMWRGRYYGKAQNPPSRDRLIRFRLCALRCPRHAHDPFHGYPNGTTRCVNRRYSQYGAEHVAQPLRGESDGDRRLARWADADRTAIRGCHAHRSFSAYESFGDWKQM
jgi:hypothetical protein